jgi:DnaJ-class molecular chaperone
MIDKSELLRNLKLLNIPIDVDFSLSDIESAYRLMAKFYHPDTKKSKNSEEKMKSINIAYEYLSKNYQEIKTLKLHNESSSTNHIKNSYNLPKFNASKYLSIFNNITIRNLMSVISWILLLSIVFGIIISFVIALISGNA